MTAGAFRWALEERLKRASLTDQIDLNRLRRQVSFDRLLARQCRGSSQPFRFHHFPRVINLLQNSRLRADTRQYNCFWAGLPKDSPMVKAADWPILRGT